MEVSIGGVIFILTLLLGGWAGWMTREVQLQRMKNQEKRMRELRRAWDHQDNIGRRIVNALGSCPNTSMGAGPVEREDKDPVKTYRYYSIRIYTWDWPGTRDLAHIDIHLLSDQGPNITWVDHSHGTDEVTQYGVDELSIQAVIRKAREFRRSCAYR